LLGSRTTTLDPGTMPRLQGRSTPFCSTPSSRPHPSPSSPTPPSPPAPPTLPTASFPSQRTTSSPRRRTATFPSLGGDRPATPGSRMRNVSPARGLRPHRPPPSHPQGQARSP
ncbi:hypothetical protein OC844_007901, partial [Tilletia horrida]